MKFKKGDKVIELLHPHTFDVAIREGFEPVEDEPEQKQEETKEKGHKCRYCDFTATNKGELLAHYREHKKEG